MSGMEVGVGRVIGGVGLSECVRVVLSVGVLLPLLLAIDPPALPGATALPALTWLLYHALTWLLYHALPPPAIQPP